MTAPASTKDPQRDGIYRIHGGDHDGGAGVLDLSVNISPLAPAPEVLSAIREAELRRYPDPRARAARAAVAERYRCEPSMVALGNGAAELLWLTCQALLRRPHARVLVSAPTFSEWEAAALAQRAVVRRVWLDQRRGFIWDMDAFDRALTRVRPALCYVCTPNNPTGTGVPFEDLRRLAGRHPRVVFVVDQAFVGLSPRAEELAELPPQNAILVRSLTKEHALPGLRVGYLLASATLVERLERLRPAWSTGAQVQAAVTAAMGVPEHVETVRARMQSDAARTRATLSAHGFACILGEAPFVLCEVGAAAAFARRLASRGVLVRDCASFSLPRHVRLSGVGDDDVARLAEVLAGVCPSATMETTA